MWSVRERVYSKNIRYAPWFRESVQTKTSALISFEAPHQNSCLAANTIISDPQNRTNLRGLCLQLTGAVPFIHLLPNNGLSDAIGVAVVFDFNDGTVHYVHICKIHSYNCHIWNTCHVHYFNWKMAMFITAINISPVDELTAIFS